MEPLRLVQGSDRESPVDAPEGAVEGSAQIHPQWIPVGWGPVLDPAPSSSQTLDPRAWVPQPRVVQAPPAASTVLAAPSAHVTQLPAVGAPSSGGGDLLRYLPNRRTALIAAALAAVAAGVPTAIVALGPGAAPRVPTLQIRHAVVAPAPTRAATARIQRAVHATLAPGSRAPQRPIRHARHLASPSALSTAPAAVHSTSSSAPVTVTRHTSSPSGHASTPVVHASTPPAHKPTATHTGGGNSSSGGSSNAGPGPSPSPGPVQNVATTVQNAVSSLPPPPIS